jgi:ATP-dependent DNA helicase RecG
MSLVFRDLERMLQNELKKRDDRLVIGGLETFISNWAIKQQTSGNPDAIAIALQVQGALKGYAAASLDERAPMLNKAITVLHGPASEAASASEPARNGSTGNRPEPRRKEQHKPAPKEKHPKRSEREPEPEHFADSELGLDAPVTRLQNVGPAHSKKLDRLGIVTVHDLLYHFPNRYDDFSHLKTISQLVYGEEVTLILTILDCKTRDSHFSRVKITNVLLGDQTGTIQATFFNQPFLKDQFRAGRKIVISGRVETDSHHLGFRHPEWEPFSNQLLHTGRVVPVYPLTEGITNRWLRRLTKPVVDYWAPRVADPLPEPILREHKLVDLNSALAEIHYPSAMDKMARARRRLAFEEFLVIQIGVLQQRRKWREQPGRPLQFEARRLADFIATLPFELTGAQKRALDEIMGDIQQTAPMSRLLQGDVGSGKTAVAAAAMLAAVWNGSQAALLAPTEILAEQHFKTLARVYGERGPRVVLLTGGTKEKDKKEIKELVANGQVDVVVGTHAIIQEDVVFKELTLAVIDEQHRFGVEQRASLRSKGFNPHILVMSATPIPRTLALTVYGDLDLSIIDEMPPGRQEIKTHWLGPGERERAYSFIRKQVAAGRQAFVLCPLIEESETIDAKAAVEEYERLKNEIYPDLRVGLIHGKLRPKEKDETMARFRDRELDILVATSVIEVGIDVPNATVMMIEGADRFGLAQLHQFRGRVGRGEHQSFCLLLAEKKESTSDERLRVIVSTQDGFKLAEEDLKLRGPGEFFGTRQSGLPDLKVAKLSDVKILEEARGAALRLFNHDPELSMPGHQLLKAKVTEFWRGKGDLS